MFILSPSLHWRIAVFGCGLMLMILPDSLRFIARGLMAIFIVLTFFWLLRPISVAGYKPDDWLRMIDICLSWSLLVVYAVCFGLIAVTGGAWWSYLIAVLVLSVVAIGVALWTGLCEMLDDDLLRTGT